MKKLFVIFIIAAMMLSITACVSDTVETDTSISDKALLDTMRKDTIEALNVGVFWYNIDDAFLSTVRESLNIELDALGIEYNNYDAAKSQATQNDQIYTAISQGANLLIVNIVDTAAIDAAQTITDKAKEADIPIIFFNREVADEVINSYENACFVGTCADEVGEAQGIMVGKYIVENYDSVDKNGDGYISYIHILGDGYGYNPEDSLDIDLNTNHYYTDWALTHSYQYNALLVNDQNFKVDLLCGYGYGKRALIVIEHCNAMLTMGGKPELVYYDANNIDRYQPGNWSKTEAFNLMETALSTNPMDSSYAIEVVIAASDDMALGCIEALNNAGWNTGDSKSIPVFGVDYSADAQAAMESGKMTGSITWSTTGMAETIAALVGNVINGENVFDGAVDIFNVDEGCSKIRVPYEIKM